MATIWVVDAPPTSAGPADDEFADAAGAGAPSGWTEVDHDTLITVAENEEGLVLTHSTSAGNSLGGVYRAVASAPWTYWCKVSLSGLGLTNTIQAGLALFEDATNANGDIASIMLRCNATEASIAYQVWSARNAISSTTSRVISVDVIPTHVYLRARLTSTTYAYDFSSDGLGWQRIQSGAHGLTGAPTHVGLVIDNNGSGADAVATFQFFRSLSSDVGLDGIAGGQRLDVFPVNAGKLSYWEPLAPPASAGADDDEFADASAGVPTGWTEIDHGSTTTVTEDTHGLTLTQPTHAGDSVAGIYKAIPAGNFTIWTKVAVSGLALTNFIGGGLALFEDATTSTADIYTLHIVTNATAVNVQFDRWNAYNSYNGNVYTRVISVDVWPTHVWLRIRRTTTTYATDFSTDGITWLQLSSGSLAVTPTHYGPFVNNVATGANVAARFPFFRYLASDVGPTAVVGGDRIGLARA